jgi:hypothetical protein
MAKSLAHVVSDTTKFVLKQASFISVSMDEVTTIDHDSWLSVHAYVYLKGKWSLESILVILMLLIEGIPVEKFVSESMSELTIFC